MLFPWDKDKHPSGGNHEILAFTVPKFVVDSLEGQAFVHNVVNKIKGYGRLSYFEDDEYYEHHAV